jgi:outer membrane protein OmpA-like peptidoglycan-associated protein
VPRDVPTIRPGRDEQLKRESISLQEIMADLEEKKVGLRLFIIDACRENPFARVAGRSLGKIRGLAVSEPPPEGTFVMYSAGAGQTALDRLNDEDMNPNSVYTRLLVPLLKSPGVVLTDVAKEVQSGVRDLAATVDHQQTPAYYDQVVGRMCIAGGACRPATRVELLPPVYGFQRDRRALSTETTSQLLRLLPEIRAEGVRKVLVHGHTNEMNTAYNINLSLIMANAVADFLIKNGVPADKVTTRSWGATRPLKEKGNPYNQRVEIELERD